MLAIEDMIDNIGSIEMELDLLKTMLNATEITIDTEARQALSDLSNRLHEAPEDAMLQLGSAALPVMDVELVIAASSDSPEASLRFVLGPSYPTELPHINIRCSQLTRHQTEDLQAAVMDHLQGYRGEPCLWESYLWMQDNLSTHFQAIPQETAVERELDCTIVREYVYFHHIYNSSKRRDILQWAHELDLHGFSVVGKPGLVCVEGPEAHVKDYVQRLRNLPWQKMQTKVALPAFVFSVFLPLSFLSFLSL